jgi:hypothetical protein
MLRFLFLLDQLDGSGNDREDEQVFRQQDAGRVYVLT